MRRLGERGTVVGLAAVGGHHRDGTGIRHHRQSAVHIGDHIILISHFTIQSFHHRHARDVGADAHHCLATRHCDILNGISRGEVCVGVGVLGQGCAVIFFCVTIGRDGQWFRSHRQCTINIGDSVILRYSFTIQGLYHCCTRHITAAAHQSLVSCQGNTLDNVADGKGTARIAFTCQGGAVIGLGGVAGGDCHSLGIDSEGAVSGGHQVVAYGGLHTGNHVHAIHRTNHVGLRANSGKGAAGSHRHHEGVVVTSFKISSREEWLRQSGAIVGLSAVLGGKHHSLGIDNEGAIHGGHQVVAHNGLHAGRYSDAIHRANHIGLRADSGKGAAGSHRHREGVIVSTLKGGSREGWLR